jgi:hypothetical protein
MAVRKSLNKSRAEAAGDVSATMARSKAAKGACHSGPQQKGSRSCLLSSVPAKT